MLGGDRGQIIRDLDIEQAACPPGLLESQSQNASQSTNPLPEMEETLPQTFPGI